MAEPWENTEVAKRIDVARAQTIDPATGKTMTQGELERRVGMTKPGERGTGYIAKLRKGERGTSLKIEWIVKLARELNVRYEWLYAGVGPMRAPEGAAPGGGRDLGLFMAAQAGRPPEIIEQVRQELEGDEHAQMDPILVLNMVEHAWQVSRNKMSAQAAHAKLGREMGAKMTTEKRKAARVEKRVQKTAPPPEAEPKPPSRRKIAVHDK